MEYIEFILDDRQNKILYDDFNKILIISIILPFENCKFENYKEQKLESTFVRMLNIFLNRSQKLWINNWNIFCLWMPSLRQSQRLRELEPFPPQLSSITLSLLSAKCGTMHFWFQKQIRTIYRHIFLVKWRYYYWVWELLWSPEWYKGGHSYRFLYCWSVVYVK